MSGDVDRNLKEGLPDFIIGGGMKCATSSMHSILSQHEEVFIPKSELHFFSIDDVVQHPSYVNIDQKRINYNVDKENKIEWYRSFFRPSRDDQVLGEDSTTYLPSVLAPSRIKSLLPGVKLIFMIRNPIDRTYSHYWHRVMTGRAVRKFEQELQHGPSILHQRSFYKTQLQRYFGLFPENQIKVVIFERFVKETESVIEEVCSYLGLSKTIDLDKVESHSNATRTPRWLRLHLLLNYALGGLQPDQYQFHLPGNARKKSEEPIRIRLTRSLLFRLRSMIETRESYPPMDPDIRDRLARIYARENRGLAELLGIDLSEYWPFMGEEYP